MLHFIYILFCFSHIAVNFLTPAAGAGDFEYMLTLLGSCVLFFSSTGEADAESWSIGGGGVEDTVGSVF